jgi:hypothetical protein
MIITRPPQYGQGGRGSVSSTGSSGSAGGGTASSCRTRPGRRGVCRLWVGSGPGGHASQMNYLPWTVLVDAAVVAIKLNFNLDGASNVSGKCYEPSYPARSMARPFGGSARLPFSGRFIVLMSLWRPFGPYDHTGEAHGKTSIDRCGSTQGRSRNKLNMSV